MMKTLASRSKNRIYINLKNLTKVDKLVRLIFKKMKKIKTIGLFVIILDEFEIVAKSEDSVIWKQLMLLKK